MGQVPLFNNQFPRVFSVTMLQLPGIYLPLSWSSQLLAGSMVNTRVAGITEMYQKKNPSPNQNRDRYRNNLRESEDNLRRRRSKEIRSRRELELEEDLVKTGSEDENDKNKRKPNRRRKYVKNKEEKTYSKLNKERREWKNQKTRKEEMLRFNDRQRKRPLGQEKQFKQYGNIRSVPNLRVTYLGSQARVSDDSSAVPLRLPKKDLQDDGLPYKTSVTRHTQNTHDLEKLMDSYRERNPKNHLSNSISNSDISGVEDLKAKARSKRASILNRAERLLHSRRMREDYSSGEDGDTEKSDRNDNVVHKRRVDYPSSDDDKYVMVKTTVSPSDSEILTDLDVALPPIPQFDSPSGKSLPSMTKSEIPVYSDDEYEVYPAQRPHTDTFREYPPFVMGRYEQSKMNSDFNEKIEVHRTTDRKGKRVTFFRNGDKDFKGVNVCINPKQFLNFEALLVYLNDRIETTSGVRYVFSLPDGKEIKSVTTFQQGRSYIVSSVKKPVLDIPYGQSREQFWNNRKPSGGRVRKSEVELFKRSESPKNAPKNKPRVITVINNEYRDKREKFYINPNTRHNFEDLLLTMGDMTNIDIHALYTEKQPHRKVESFSQLFNEFKNQENFIACGPELVPLKPENVKRPAPSSNSGSDSMSVASRMKKFHKATDGELDEIDEYGMQHSPSPQEGILNGVPVNGYQEPISARHSEEDDSVKFTIRGRVREYFPPSITYPDDDGQRPDKKLKLEWIYGFHAREGCKSVVVFRTGELLYYVAAVAVFFRRNDERGDTQRHYLGHTEDISCLELHPSENWVASGQIAGKENPAHVRIWDGEKLTTYHVIGINFFTHGIASIGFSEQSRGGFMCVTDSSDKHVLSIWDWEKEKMIAKTTTTTKTVNCCCFYKFDDTLLITYGADHLFFWRLFWDPIGVQDGKLYRDKLSGTFEEGTQPAMITSHAFSSSGDVITGDSNGSIMVWTKDTEYVFNVNVDVSAEMKGAHLKPVNALCMMGDNTLLSGGGTFIKSWDSINNYRKISKREIPEIAGNVRTIIPQRGSGADGQIYVGTSKSCILAGSLPVKFRFIVQGHCKDIWAIAAVPGETAFITTAHDQFVFKWSAVKHRVVWRSQMEKPSSALAVDNRGIYVAVGSVAGRFFVLNARNGMHIITVQVGKSQINAMRFSPDNAMLAVGCEDGHIHIFYVHDEGQIYRKNNIILRGHGKFVTNLDWSTDSRYLQSVDGDFELLCWNIQRMEREAPRALRDCNWQTYSCCAGHPLMGPWTSCDPGETVSVVARSNYREVIVTGDNTGRIKVFKYPSSTNMPACRWTKLYSSTVTALEFLYDDSFMVSAAGKMPVLAQWSVVDTFSGKQYNT
ncbi:echinoderm microtubule-associated protein-like 1 isoform X2 [Saccostrea echinata]|uniref:echinoderm microtubule-associated protein-like 1 isoform X2 n=1 Tax=Saccostrea echinata TaxID=191078 RepID=UPI002A812FD9|nr:echinoderm microtubule-associated protein-like 1 isoform X2 [Saccostrea echinata]